MPPTREFWQTSFFSGVWVSKQLLFLFRCQWTKTEQHRKQSSVFTACPGSLHCSSQIQVSAALSGTQLTEPLQFHPRNYPLSTPTPQNRPHLLRLSFYPTPPTVQTQKTQNHEKNLWKDTCNPELCFPCFLSKLYLLVYLQLHGRIENEEPRTHKTVRNWGNEEEEPGQFSYRAKNGFKCLPVLTTARSVPMVLQPQESIKAVGWMNRKRMVLEKFPSTSRRTKIWCRSDQLLQEH